MHIDLRYRQFLGPMLGLLAVTILPREPDPGELRLGQRVYVDDGSCPPGRSRRSRAPT
jgi:hypothetical protein